MASGNLNITESALAGDWIAPRLRGDFGAVTLAVPSGYAAYVRICHPATDTQNHAVSWSEVARATGRVAHPLMQWHALVGSPDCSKFKGSLWPGGNPERGDLAPRQLDLLCEILGKHTTDANHCSFAVWEGWGWVHGSEVTIYLCSAGSTPPERERALATFSKEELSHPRLELPHREYILLDGPLSAIAQLGETSSLDRFSRKSPNLFWPADHSWCAASEIDFDSTLVGGSHDLIEAVLGAAELDAWPVGPDDSLASFGDRINHVPDRGAAQG